MNALAEISGNDSSLTFRFNSGVQPNTYRARLFYNYAGTNDFTGVTPTGMYARSDDEDDIISYDDWNSPFRPAYVDIPGSSADLSFNMEIDCIFDTLVDIHTLVFIDERDKPVTLSGASYISGQYLPGNLPVNILMEELESSCDIDEIAYSPADGTVTVKTREAHGFSTGDAIAISGLPAGVHSTGVHGERYNGTYRIRVVDETTFSYTTAFYSTGEYPVLRYTSDDCEHIVGSKWISCGYYVDKTIEPSISEALVIWEGNTFMRNDRITLVTPYDEMVRDAIVDTPSPNAFVCRSSEIALDSSFVQVLYSPRTPVRDIPSNPIADEYGEPMVDNRSTREISTVNDTRTPIQLAGFDLDSPDGSTVGDGFDITTRKFVALKFNPSTGMGSRTGNRFKFTVRVTGSTEVVTDLCMFQLADNSWSGSSDANEVYSKIVSVPLSRVEVSTHSVETQQDWSCDFSSHPEVSFVVDSATGDKWVSDNRTVSLVIVLYGRDGAVVSITGNVTIVQVCTADADIDTVPIPVKAVPAFASPGDTVTLYSLDDREFTSLTGNLRVAIGNTEDPDDWVRVTGNTGGSISFVAPGTISGRHPVRVMQLVDGEWKTRTDSIDFDIYVSEPGLVKLNDRLAAGEITGNVSYHAKYNRDLGFAGFSEITDDNSLIQNLYSCLLTRKGERLFNRSFGSSLEEMVFSLIDSNSDTELMKECLDVISRYEPRITLIYDQCHVEEAGPNAICLVLGVEVPGGNMQTISIPFKYRGILV